jgi:hypothetical protein
MWYAMVFSSMSLMRAFLGAQATGKVAEVVHGERNVGVQRFADGLAVVHGFGIGQQFQVGFDAVGNLEQDVGCAWRRRSCPRLVGGCVGGVQRQFNVFGGGAGGLGVGLAVITGVMTSKYWPLTGATNLPPMKLSYWAL